MKQERIKSRMSPEERAKRRAAVGKAASEKIAKSEQMNFRLEEHSIRELQSMALKKGLPVGTMIRDWVLERLSQEKLGSPELTAKALHMLDEMHEQLNQLFDSQYTPMVNESASMSIAAYKRAKPKTNSSTGTKMAGRKRTAAKRAPVKQKATGRKLQRASAAKR